MQPPSCLNFSEMLHVSGLVQKASRVHDSKTILDDPGIKPLINKAYGLIMIKGGRTQCA